MGTGKEKITVIIGRLSVRLWAHAYKKLRKMSMFSKNSYKTEDQSNIHTAEKQF